jgi:hypothetical protein
MSRESVQRLLGRIAHPQATQRMEVAYGTTLPVNGDLVDESAPPANDTVLQGPPEKGRDVRAKNPSKSGLTVAWGGGTGTRYTLTVLIDSLDPGATATLDPPGGEYDDGTVVTVTGVPSSGFIFDHWELIIPNEANSTDNPVSVNMGINRTISLFCTLSP